MPQNVIYVGRPTKWGNPYKLSEYGYACLQMYEDWLRQQLKNNPSFLEPLRGKDLACWCPLDKPCHVDIIMKLLTETERTLKETVNA
jgi:hypothetical protein